MPPWPVGFEGLCVSHVINSAACVGLLGRLFILGKVERGSHSLAGFPGPEWRNPFDFSTEKIRGGCHRKRLSMELYNALFAATFIPLNVTHNERQAYSGRHRADSMAGVLQFRRLSW